MNKLILSIIFLNILACSTAQNKEYKNTSENHPYSKDPLEHGYRVIHNNNCISILHKENNLYLLLKNELIVYNLKTRAFISGDFYHLAREKNIPNAAQLICSRKGNSMFYGRIYNIEQKNVKYLKSDSLAKILEEILKNPELTPKYISSKELSTRNFDENLFNTGINFGLTTKASISDIGQAVSSITEDQIYKKISIHEEEIKEFHNQKKHQKEIQEQQSRKIEEKDFKYKSWLNREKSNLNIGDKICSYSNYYGYVESINKNKIKFFVTGTALNKEAGFFFSGGGIFSAKKQSEYIWVSRDEVDLCNFGSYF